MSNVKKYSAKIKSRIFISLFLLFMLTIGLSLSTSYLNNADNNLSYASRASGDNRCRDNPESAPSGMKWTAQCDLSYRCVTNADCQELFPGRSTKCYQFADQVTTPVDWRCITLDPVTTVNPETYLQLEQ